MTRRAGLLAYRARLALPLARHQYQVPFRAGLEAVAAPGVSEVAGCSSADFAHRDPVPASTGSQRRAGRINLPARHHHGRFQPSTDSLAG
jgi:hypothetical protein